MENIIGIICGSVITAVIGPVIVAYMQRPKQANGNEDTSNISRLAITSFVLGLLNLGSWVLPICGFPMSILGLIFGFASLNSPKRALAITGIVLSLIGLISSIINSALAAFLLLFV